MVVHWHSQTARSHVRVHFQCLWYLCVLIMGIKNIFSGPKNQGRKHANYYGNTVHPIYVCIYIYRLHLKRSSLMYSKEYVRIVQFLVRGYCSASVHHAPFWFTLVRIFVQATFHQFLSSLKTNAEHERRATHLQYTFIYSAPSTKHHYQPCLLLCIITTINITTIN